MPLRRAHLLSFVFLATSAPLLAQQTFRLTCTPKSPTSLTAADRYTPSRAGFDILASPDTFARRSCASDHAFFFSAPEPDGDFQITLVLGGSIASTTTVRTESRRLFINQLAIAANASRTVTFNVNVRTKVIASATPPAEVKLKPREIGALDWDDKLTLEFSGDHPSFRSIDIRPIATVPTIYLAGDSTVVDQDKEPWAAWGQMLPAFFTSRVAIANEAESGETIRSFVGERRLAKIMSTIKSGDFLMIQFAHNDQKPGSGFVSILDYKIFSANTSPRHARRAPRQSSSPA